MKNYFVEQCRSSTSHVRFNRFLSDFQCEMISSLLNGECSSALPLLGLALDGLIEVLSCHTSSCLSLFGLEIVKTLFVSSNAGVGHGFNRVHASLESQLMCCWNPRLSSTWIWTSPLTQHRFTFCRSCRAMHPSSSCNSLTWAPQARPFYFKIIGIHLLTHNIRYAKEWVH